MKMVKLFSIPSGEQFLYDAMSNRIIPLQTKGDVDTNHLITQLCSSGRLYNESFPCIVFPFTIEEYREKLQREISRLTLEVTQRCNMRCTYCVYSGNYVHMRTHSDLRMGWDIMKKSIDFYAAHNVDCGDADISFYGGEALLEFGLIKTAVAYAHGKFHGKSLHMGISSNGTLLTPEVAAWLSENPDVSVTITLNGPYQDRYRRLMDGGGSLDLIMDRLRFIRGNYPEVWKRQILLICNIASAEELLGIRQFYISSVGKFPTLITGVVPENGNSVIQEIISARQNGRKTGDILKKIYFEENDEFLHRYFRFDLSDMHERRIFPSGMNGLSGSCAPFLSQLFVASDGRFQICEKVCDSPDLGDIENGWNMAVAEALYSGIINLFHNKCRNCWGQRTCTVCYKDVVGKTGLCHTIPDDVCETMRNHILRTLQLYCEMAYHYPLVFRRYLDK